MDDLLTVLVHLSSSISVQSPDGKEGPSPLVEDADSELTSLEDWLCGAEEESGPSSCLGKAVPQQTSATHNPKYYFL
jgi:hypothetical protein